MSETPAPTLPEPDARTTPATAAADAPAPPEAPGSPEVPGSPGDRAVAAKGHRTVRSLLRLWPYVRRVRGRLCSAAAVAIAASSVGLVIPLVLKWIVDEPVAHHDPGGVWLGALYLLLLGIAEACLFGLRRWMVARPLAGVEAGMRSDLYSHLQRLPVAFHDRWASGQLLSRATTDLMLIRMFLAFPLTFLLVNGATILIGVVILLAQQWVLGLVLLAPAVPLMVVCAFFETRYAIVARQAQDQVGDLTTVVEEGVLGIRIIKGFGRHRSQAAAFRTLTYRLRGTELAKARLLAWIWAVIMTLPELAIGAALVLGTLQVADGTVSAGTLVAFLSTALALRWPIESIGFLLAMTQESATATERYFEVLDAERETEHVPADGIASGAGTTTTVAAAGTTTAPATATAATTSREAASTSKAATPTSTGTGPTSTEAAPVPPAAGARGTSPATAAPEPTATPTPAPPPAPAPAPAPAPTLATASRGASSGLRFEAVEFRYPDAPPSAPPVLSHIDLHIVPGETMALVGATGSGKTTLTSLVPRLHEPTAGRITLDGEDITAIPRARLRTLVSVAFEEPTLFSTSVAENVLMGAADGAGDEELRRALSVAQAEFVDQLPEGATTQVGEQGLSLSGGQRQRLALARAVVGRPRFLVLDDPLSALDVHTEALVEAALRQVLADTTALVVAHRPSTVLLADRVALLDQGRIVAVGTHQELLRSTPGYAWLMSATGPEDAAASPVRAPAPAPAGTRIATASAAPSSASAPEGKQER